MAADVESPFEISWNIGDENDTEKPLTKSDSQPFLPSITENGIRLGTPVAREAAKSFWSMDMFKTSLNRMAFYADCENHSQGSLGSPDSGFHSRTTSTRGTPTTPQLPRLAASSAPSSPQSVTRHGRITPVGADSSDDESPFLGPPVLHSVRDSPLLVARREREANATPTPTQNSEPSTTSLSSSSKTISPSHSSQILLPKRRMVGRSHSANPIVWRKDLQPLQRRLTGARSDSSVHRLKNSASPITELRYRSNFLFN